MVARVALSGSVTGLATQPVYRRCIAPAASVSTARCGCAAGVSVSNRICAVDGHVCAWSHMVNLCISALRKLSSRAADETPPRPREKQR